LTEPNTPPPPTEQPPSTGEPVAAHPVTPEQPELPRLPTTEPQTQKKPNLHLIFLSLFIACLIPALAAISILLPLPIKEEKTVVIPRGTKVREIAMKLQDEGLTPNRIIFRIASRILANDNLQAGEYKFKPEQNLADAVLMLRNGESIVRMFTAAEGLTSTEIINLLKNDPTMTGDIVAAPAEGSLLPETYRYSYGDTRKSLVERMQKSRRDVLNELWAKREASLPLKTPQEAVIMASIIEKETGKKCEERARVAGVFYNRLKLRMPLQSDPTVIYALTKGQKPLGRELTREDLATNSPYNTYTNPGLPPGPISNPGKASLEAALHPEKHDFLYFVADGTGGHVFAKDLSAHNKNVNRWLCLPKP
jgi:UPF0755 protein